MHYIINNLLKQINKYYIVPKWESSKIASIADIMKNPRAINYMKLNGLCDEYLYLAYRNPGAIKLIKKSIKLKIVNHLYINIISENPNIKIFKMGIVINEKMCMLNNPNIYKIIKLKLINNIDYNCIYKNKYISNIQYFKLLKMNFDIDIYWYILKNKIKNKLKYDAENKLNHDIFRFNKKIYKLNILNLLNKVN